MYLMYVDEAGDCGLNGSPTNYFVLTGIVLHELRWHNCLDSLVDFRTQLRNHFGLKLREEFHAAAMITNPGDLVRIVRHERLAMIRLFTERLATMDDLNIISVVVDKSTKNLDYDVFGNAWRALIQRFENTARKRNFRGPRNADERCMLFCDHTDDRKLTRLIRRLRRYNPIPNQQPHGTGARNLPLELITDSPNFRNSADSYFVQMADLVAFLLYQHLCPNAYMRKKGGKNLFLKLDPIVCTHASPNSRLGHGIVCL